MHANRYKHTSISIRVAVLAGDKFFGKKRAIYLTASLEIENILSIPMEMNRYSNNASGITAAVFNTQRKSTDLDGYPDCIA